MGEIMNKCLKIQRGILYHIVNGARVDGPHDRITGDASGLTGDASGITGDVSGISGDVSGLTGCVSGISGCVTGLWGNIDDAGLTNAVRKTGVNIRDLCQDN